MWPGDDNDVTGASSPRSQMLEENKEIEADPLKLKALTKAESTKMVGQKALPRGQGNIDEDSYEKGVAAMTTEVLVSPEGWRLYLGHEEQHCRPEVLQMKGYEVTHLLNVQPAAKKYLEKEIVNEGYRLADLTSEVILPLCKQAKKLWTTVKKNKGTLLIVCKDKGTDGKKDAYLSATYSRSGLMAVSIIMDTHKCMPEDAIAFLNDQRKKMFQPPVKINHGFVRQLKTWAQELGLKKKKK